MFWFVGRGRISWRRAVFVAVVAGGILCGLLLAARIATFPATVNEGHYDACIVLGARVVDGVPTPVFAARIDHAVQLFKRGIVDHIVFTGGNPPPKALYDSEAARDYAVAKGVPSEATFTETVSRTTLQNLREARQIVSREGWAKVLIVSDPYHLYRASRMAAYLGLPADVSATPSTRFRSLARKLPFLLREAYLNVHFTLFHQ